jgi:tetratricopeptide (TPR) repeat protein
MGSERARVLARCRRQGGIQLEEGAAFEQALDHARADGGPGLLAQALRNLATAYRGLDRLEEARSCLREALEWNARHGNLSFSAQVQDSLARRLVARGHFHEAEARFEQNGAVYARQDPLSPR